MYKSLFDDITQTNETTTALTSDLAKITAELAGEGRVLNEEQQEARDAAVAANEGAAAVASQDATLQNLIIDKQFQNAQKLQDSHEKLEEMYNPVKMAQEVNAKQKELESATAEYNEVSADANSPNPFVAIPAYFKQASVKAKMDGAARDVNNTVTGFNNAKEAHALNLSQYQTRTNYITESQADAAKELNTLKAVQVKLNGNAQIEAKDLDYFAQRYQIKKDKMDGIIKRLNAETAKGNTQTAVLQAKLHAEMLPLQIEQMEMQVDAMKDNKAKREAIEAQVAIVDPSINLPANWDDPSVFKTMDYRTISTLQRVMGGISTQDPNVIQTSELRQMAASGDRMAIAAMSARDSMVEQANQLYVAGLDEVEKLSGKYTLPYDPRDPEFDRKVDNLVMQYQESAEKVDATSAFKSGMVALSSSKDMERMGELDWDAGVSAGLYSAEVAELFKASDFELVAVSDGVESQVSTSIQSIVNAAVQREKQTGKQLSSVELAGAYTYWAKKSLQRSNASQLTGMQFSQLTLPSVDAFSSQQSALGNYAVTAKPLTLTDINQVAARMESLRKRTLRINKANSINARDGQGTPDDAPTPLSFSPFGWMNIQQ